MEKWSSAHDWVERAAAWDAELARRRREASWKEIDEMTRRHAIRASEGIDALMQAPLALLEKIAAEEDDATPELERESMTRLIQLSAQGARAIAQLMQAERLARGLATEAIRMDAQVGNPRRRVDPLQTQDEYALDLLEAMIEAGLVPAPATKTGSL